MTFKSDNGDDEKKKKVRTGFVDIEESIWNQIEPFFSDFVTTPKEETKGASSPRFFLSCPHSFLSPLLPLRVEGWIASPRDDVRSNRSMAIDIPFTLVRTSPSQSPPPPPPPLLVMNL